MDHEERFVATVAASEAEVVDGVTRGWTAGFARRENCPERLAGRMQQFGLMPLLLEMLEEHKPGGDIQAADVAWSVLTLTPARPGLWAERGFSWDFGPDNDNPDFLLGFFVGITGLHTLQELTEMLCSNDTAE